MATGDMAFFSRPSSSAVKIVAPSTSSEPSSPKPSPRKDSTQRQCRNILIYGSCKYQDKGCIYYHPSRDNPSPVPPDSPVPAAVLPAQSVNAPVFVPKTPVPQPARPASVPAPAAVEYYHSQSSSSSSGPSEFHGEPETYDHYGFSNPSGEPHADMVAEQMQAMDVNPYGTSAEGQHMMGYDTPHTMDVFYSTQSTFVRQPLNYHLYTEPRPESLQYRYFVSDAVREELQRRSETIHTAPAPGLGLPDELQGYHTLVPLEPINSERRKFGSWYSAVYRAVNAREGVPCVLRRIENFRLQQQAAFSAIETWSRIRHPSIITVWEAFTTRAFNDNSLVVVYDYHPNSQTIYEAHIKPKPPQFQNGRLQAQNTRLPERTIWSYVIQIGSAIKAVHDAGLAVRIVDATKILVTGKNRVRISSCGLVDVLMYEARQDIPLLQQEDLTMFGKLIFTLCGNNLATTTNLPKTLENFSRYYSQDLKNVAVFLVSKPTPHKKIGALIDSVGPRMLMELDESQDAVDRLEGELMSELENGRLVRLLCKFGFINERPEFARDARWSETGDRYIVKLFRDYVFHQVDEHGRPVVNLSYVLTCLNKLDAGSDERIMLVSRDEQSCLVVTYKEIKSCIDSAFSELGMGAG